MKNDKEPHNSNSISMAQKLSTIQNLIRSLEIVTQNLVGARKVVERNLKEEPNGLESGLITCFLGSAYANCIKMDLKILDLMSAPAPVAGACKPKNTSLRLVSCKAKQIFTDTDYPDV